MMFKDSGGDIDDAVGDVGHYGKNLWLGRPTNSVMSDEIHDDVVAALMKNPKLLKGYQGMHPDLRSTAEALAGEMSPSRIVDSAGFWDAPDLVKYIQKTVLEPRGYKSVITPDGMISFDPSGVKSYGP
jgi:hypothetical protein